MNDKSFKASLAKANEFLKIAGVVGVAETNLDKKQAILVIYTENEAIVKKSIPKHINDFPIVFQFTGAINIQE